jgi:hypothetical protein
VANEVAGTDLMDSVSMFLPNRGYITQEPPAAPLSMSSLSPQALAVLPCVTATAALHRGPAPASELVPMPRVAEEVTGVQPVVDEAGSAWLQRGAQTEAACGAAPAAGPSNQAWSGWSQPAPSATWWTDASGPLSGVGVPPVNKGPSPAELGTVHVQGHRARRTDATEPSWSSGIVSGYKLIVQNLYVAPDNADAIRVWCHDSGVPNPRDISVSYPGHSGTAQIFLTFDTPADCALAKGLIARWETPYPAHIGNVREFGKARCIFYSSP